MGPTNKPTATWLQRERELSLEPYQLVILPAAR